MLWTLKEAGMEKEGGEGEPMEGSEGLREAFVVAGEAAEAGCPGKGAFDDPAAREEDETAFGFGEFDHVEADGVGGGGARGSFASVALIHVGQLHGLSGGRLDCLGQCADLGAFLLVGGRTVSASKWPSVSTAICTLQPLRRL